MQEKIYGVDLGTSAVKLYLRESQSVVIQKNMIAIEGREKIIAYGDKAYEMYEKTPKKIRVIQPVKNGVISDSDSMEEILNLIISESEKKSSAFSKRSFIVAIPSNITEVEKKAFYDLMYSSGAKAKNIKMVDKPVAAAIGAGIEVLEPKGRMVVDIGADTTEIAIISLGGIVASKVLKMGGNRMNEFVMQQIRREYKLLCGQKTAERVKIQLGNAVSSENEIFMEVVGRDVLNGLPKKLQVSSAIVYEVLKEQLKTLLDEVKFMLEETPPELSADIINDGIYFIGGTSQLTNLDIFAQEETGLTINMIEEPDKAVAAGIGKIVEESELRDLAITFDDLD